MSQTSTDHEAHAEVVEDIDPLDAFEESLQGVVRSVRARVRPGADPAEPTAVETAVSENPFLATSIAAGAGLALGLLVRRFTRFLPRR